MSYFNLESNDLEFSVCSLLTSEEQPGTSIKFFMCDNYR